MEKHYKKEMPFCSFCHANMTLVIQLESEAEFVGDSAAQKRCYTQQKMNLNA